MNDILNAQFIIDFSEIIDAMYRLGWDERNGGNVSYLLTENDVLPYLKINQSLGTIKLDFDAKELNGKIFLITGTGKYFRNLKKDPESNCGIIKINEDGWSANILWGFKNTKGPTSEINTHLHAHIVRLQVDPNHRVVIHCHATNLLAMSFIHDLDEREFTRTLWKMCTECIIVFPEGVGLIPWMIPGNVEIGEATAKKIKESKIVLWPMHGIFGCGDSLDDAFGLIETAEKAAEIYLKIFRFPIKQVITDKELMDLSVAFGVKPKDGYLVSGGNHEKI